MKKRFYSEISSEFIKEFKIKVGDSQQIVITSHKSPDDDSISSILSTYYYLTNVLRVDTSKIRMINTGEKSERWDYFKNYDKVKFVDDLANHLKGVDLLIILDASGWNRLSNIEKIKEFTGYTICIDHHANPKDEFDLHTVLSPYSSTSQIIHDMLFVDEQLNKEISETMLFGILGDTGNFKYTTPSISSVLIAARRMIDQGNIKVEKLRSEYEGLSYKSFQVLGELTKNVVLRSLENWPDFLVSFVDRDFISKNEIAEKDIGEASGHFAEYLKGIRDIGWGFVVTPRDNRDSRVSFRSIPNSVNVRDIVEKMKIGGGHDRAAGGDFEKVDPKDAVEKITNWMEENKPVIN